MHFSRRHVLPAGIIMLFLLGGCGYNAGTGSTPPSTSPTALPPIGSVFLRVGAATYQAGESIHATILNQSKQTISFTDHKTNCSVLLFEHQMGSSWEPVAPCKLMIKTRLLSLQAGATLNVNLTPTLQWPAGTYRARLDYSVLSGSVSAPKTIYSSSFVWTDGDQSK